MKRLLVGAALLLAASAEASGTKRDVTLSEMFIRPGLFGLPRYAADPFTCDATTKSAVYYNTAADTAYLCNGSAWGGLGGVSSPIAGDFVATGKWTFGSAADAAGSVRLGEAASCVVYEGATANAFETRLCATDPTVGVGTINLPDLATAGSDTLAVLALGQTLLAKKISVGAVATEGQLGLNTTSAPDITTLETGTTANSIHIIETADNAYNFTNGPCGGVACTDQTWVIHSHNQATTEWLALSHNGTDGQIDVGTGALEFLDSFQLKSSGAGTPVTFAVPKINTTGANNTVIGAGTTGNALAAKTDVVMLGYNAGTIIGNGGVVIGSSITTGDRGQATLVGYAAGSGLDGDWNTVVGHSAGGDVDTANTLVGYAAFGGDASNTFSNNVGIGAAAGLELRDASVGNVCIGSAYVGTGNACGSVSAASQVRSYGIAIGMDADLSADHQAVFGGDVAYVDNVFFGSGTIDATPTSATVQATGGYGTDIAGASLTVAGGKGTGTGLGGDVNVSVAPQSTTGTTANALVVQSKTVAKRFTINDNSATAILNITAPTSDSCMLTLSYTAKTLDASDIQSRAGFVHVLVNEDPNAASYACSTEEQATVPTSLVTGGTYTSAWTCTAGATTAVNVTLDSSLNTASTFQFTVLNNSGCVLAVP